MPIDNGNLALKGLDDLFSTEENRQEEQREQVQQIPIDALHPFTNHPFKVLDDEAMTRTVESIAQYGVLAPLIARPRPDGNGYEIISGHRRQYAAKLAGLDTLPVIVRQMSDDAAVILMVDSNLQREHILPSERAFAYKMKLEALKNQGARSDLTSCQLGTKFRADESLAEDSGESARNVQRFIRLTNLIPELLDMVDEKKISFNPAVELSYLDESQGKQSVRTLLRQNRGVSSVEISKTGIRGLERYAKKYGIDYAIRKDNSEVPPRYLVFFKAPDAEAFHSAFKEYSASLLNKDKRPSVLAKLHELVQAAAELPGKVRHKEQERGL